MEKIKSRYVILTFIVLISAVYFNSLKTPFFGDAWKLIRDNPYIKTWASFPKLFTREYFYTFGDLSARLVTSFSYLVDYTLWKMNPVGWQISSLITHCVCVIFIYLLINRATKNKIVAFFTSAIFAIHPIHAEIINEVSSREDIQALALMLISFYCYLETFDKSKRIFEILYAVGCSIAFLLALFTKESAIMLPFIIALYDYAFRSKFYFKRYVIYFLPSLAFYLVITTFYLYPPVATPGEFGREANYPGGNIFTATMTTVEVTVFYYFSKLLYPGKLLCGIGCPVTDFGPKFYIAVIIILIVLLVGLYFRKRQPIIFFGIFYFFLNLLPVSNIIPIGLTASERYAYIPSIGFFIIISVILHGLFKEKKLLMWMVFIVIILTYSFTTVKRNLEFKNPFIMYERELIHSPEDYAAYAALGVCHLHYNNYNLAVDYYKKAIEFLVLKLRDMKYYDRNYYDQHPGYIFWIGYACWKKGNEDSAKKYFEDFVKNAPLRLKKKNYFPYFCLGDYYFRGGNLEKSRYYFSVGLKYNPYCPYSFQNIGLIDLMRTDFDSAMKNLQKAIKLDPENFQALNNIGVVYIFQEDFNSAERVLNKALENAPDEPDVYYNLAIVEHNLGNRLDAERMLKKYFEFKNEVLEIDYDRIFDELFISPKGIFASTKSES